MADCQPKLHTYNALPNPFSTRLIRLHPLNTTQDAFNCSFEIVDIRKLPRYIAISYRWGDPEDMVPISWSDGTVIMTTRPILNLLTRLARFEQRILPLWIDSLCINQGGLEERSQQVTIMSKIYSGAMNVSVWLEADLSDDADVVFGALNELVKLFTLVKQLDGKVSHLDPDTWEIQWIHSSGQAYMMLLPDAIAKPSDRELNALVRFFNLPWFTRTWTLQETGLAAEADVIWGRSRIGWNTIGTAAMILRRFGEPITDKLGLTDAVENIYHIYTSFSPFTPLGSLFHLVNNTRRLKAGDPRDKIFALLAHPTAQGTGPRRGLYQNANAFREHLDVILQVLPKLQDEYLVRTGFEKLKIKSSSDPSSVSGLTPIVKVDYTKSVDDIYRDFALQHIERTESLEILAGVQHEQDLSELSELSSPSWVPDWRQNTNTSSLGLYSSNHFAACNRRAVVQPWSSQKPEELIVRGHLISRVIYTSEELSVASFDLPSDPSSTSADSPNAVASNWLRSGCHQIHSNPGGPSNMPGGAIYPRGPLVVADGFAKLDDPLSYWGAYLSTWVAGKRLSEVDGFDFDNDSFEYFSRLFPRVKEYYPETESKMRAERYRLSVAHVATNRKFFIVKKDFMGLGPRAMQVGDWVAVLLGADVPFILREVDVEKRERAGGGGGGVGGGGGGPVPDRARFQVVGECFVQGLMQGQGVRGLEVRRDIVLV